MLVLFPVSVRSISISGKKLAEYRLAAGLTQEQFAQKVGRTTSRIYKTEREDVSQMFSASVLKYADVLGMTREEFIEKIAIREEGAVASLSLPLSNPHLQAELRRQAQIHGKTEAEIITEILMERFSPAPPAQQQVKKRKGA